MSSGPGQPELRNGAVSLDQISLLYDFSLRYFEDLLKAFEICSPIPWGDVIKTDFTFWIRMQFEINEFSVRHAGKVAPLS